MNWLAHLLLSEPSPAFRIGNLLPDIVPASVIEAMPEDYRRGAACHRRIDAFTDGHPLFRRSCARFSPVFRRYARVLTDVFYDHFLARDWPCYGPGTLNHFVASVYASFDECRSDLTPELYARLVLMRDHDLLGSYRSTDGVRAALDRMSLRLRRPFPLGSSVAELEDHYAGFGSDFAGFFPELSAHVSAEMTDRDGSSRSESAPQ